MQTGGSVNVWSKEVTLTNTIRPKFKLRDGSDELLAEFTAKYVARTACY